jgi:hypothetical protein
MRYEVGSDWLVGKNLKGQACNLLQDTMLHLVQHSKDILSIASKNLRFKSGLTVVSKDGNFVL